MSTLTTNYKLTKPDVNDFYNINVQNTNMDIIDGEIASRRKNNTTVSISNFLPSLTKETDIRELMHNIPSGHYAFTPSASPLIKVPDVSCGDAQIDWERQDNPNGSTYGTLLYSSMYRDSPTTPIKPSVVYHSSICNDVCYTAWKKIIDSTMVEDVTDVTSAFSGATGVTLSSATFKRRGNTVYFELMASVSQEISATGAIVVGTSHYPIVRQGITVRYDTVSTTAASTHNLKKYQCVDGQVLKYNSNTVISSGLSLYSGDVIYVFGSYDV